jgi:hypothetical protein
MKQSNLAWRMELFEAAPVSAESVRPVQRTSTTDAHSSIRRRPSFERRIIEIRDQGFAPFRVR